MNEKKFDTIVALYVVCSAYHSGQYSRGYRLLSRIDSLYSPKNLPSLTTLLKHTKTYGEWFEAGLIAKTIIRKYKGKL